MNQFKLMCFIPLFAVGLSHATTVPCNGFKIGLKNKLSEELMIQKIQLTDATLRTDGNQTINAGKKQLLTVTDSVAGNTMNGEVTLMTTTTPTKLVTIKFNLINRDAICELDQFDSEGALAVHKTRLPGGVNYTIRY